jgi:hypothetical protein
MGFALFEMPTVDVRADGGSTCSCSCNCDCGMFHWVRHFGASGARSGGYSAGESVDPVAQQTGQVRF